MRRPLALANWKMAMTVAESLAFVRDVQATAGDALDQVDVVICPPYTALWPLSQALQGSRLQLGAQNMAPTNDPARTGEIAAPLLVDAGCRRVMLGHWEVRRHQGDDDATVNRKVRLACKNSLAPILFIGEERAPAASDPGALTQRLERLLAGCTPDDIAQMAFVYEPEAAIGVATPVTASRLAASVAAIRAWLRAGWDAAAEATQIIYGGSVAPEHAADLLAASDLDGLGATRRGRDPVAFAEIIRRIAEAKAPRR